MLAMLPPCLLALLSSYSVLALSSSSPPDLFAHPAYQVVLTRDLISNSTATELLALQPDDRAGFSSHLMRTASGQAFLCQYGKPVAPDALSKAETASNTEKRQARAKVDKKAGLERGLALLEPLKSGGCLYQRQGWFTCMLIACESSAIS